MRTQPQRTIPTHIHGFRVELGTGPYPPDQPRSPDRAVYAKLYPDTPTTRERMAHMGRTVILGAQPITQQAMHLPDDRLAETAGVSALRQAAAIARTVGS